MLKYEARFSIADIKFSVQTNRAEPINRLKQGCAAYLVNEDPEVKISLYYKRKSPSSLRNRLFTMPYNIYGSIDIEGSYDLRLYTNRDYIGIGDVLRFLTSVILIRQGGFLIHSCGVIIDKGAYILSGPSGSGKTTIARLVNNGSTLLSDETTAVVKKDKGYYSYATPFFGDFGRITQNKKAPLKGILFLKKSTKFSHKRIRASFAAARLLENIFLIGDKKGYNINRLFDIVSDVAEKVPLYELGFLPDINIWRYIKERIFPGA